MLAMIFVCVPPDFELENFLSIRESADIFEKEGVSLKEMKLYAQSIRCSPISYFNSKTLLQSQMKLIEILKDLHVVIEEKIDYDAGFYHMDGARWSINHNRMDRESFSRYAKPTDCVVFVNLALLPDMKEYGKAVEKMVALEDYKISEEIFASLSR